MSKKTGSEVENEVDAVPESSSAYDPPADMPQAIIDAGAPDLPPIALAAHFGEHDDTQRFHATHAQKHLHAIGFKTQLEPTGLTIWLEHTR